MKLTLAIGQRVVIRRRHPDYDQDYPDEYGIIEPIDGQATAMSYRRGTRGKRCLIRLDNGQLCESFANNVFPTKPISGRRLNKIYEKFEMKQRR